MNKSNLLRSTILLSVVPIIH